MWQAHLVIGIGIIMKKEAHWCTSLIMNSFYKDPGCCALCTDY